MDDGHCRVVLVRTSQRAEGAARSERLLVIVKKGIPNTIRCGHLVAVNDGDSECSMRLQVRLKMLLWR